MEFEWDPKKSIRNAEKHGIDFNSSKRLWEDEKRVLVEAPHPVKDRYILIAKLGNRHWSAVYTYRQSAVRIISVRRSRKKEKELYETGKGS